MKYIELSQSDIDYINNRAVICYYINKPVIFEPLPDSLISYFENRERLQYIDKTEWHEPDKQIQIILTLEQNTDLVTNVPEIAMYRKEHDINAYRDENKVYSYVNWLLEEHEQLLLSYGAIINKIDTAKE